MKTLKQYINEDFKISKNTTRELTPADYEYDEKRDRYNAKEFKVGDILDASFQYTAKFARLYYVVRRTASSIWVVQLKTKVVNDDGYGQNGSVMPILELPENAKTIMGRITPRGSVKIDDSLASLWNGKPVDFWSD